MKIFSFEASSNGYYGQPFVVGAVVTDDNGEVARYLARCPIEEKTDKWLAKNVLPHIEDVFVNQKSYQALLNNFYEFYEAHKDLADVIAHVAHPVETKLLRDMIEQDEDMRRYDGPDPLIDLASVLHAKGEEPHSASSYNKKNNLTIPFVGHIYHPLYDAFCAEVAYRHIMQ